MGFEICGILVLWEKGGEEGRNSERRVGQEPWSIKVCNKAIRAAVKSTGNKPFPNYSVEIAEMLGEEVEDMRIRLPLVVNDLCAEVMYDMGVTHLHCDEVWARKYGVRWKSRREYAVTQSGLEVLVKGEAWVKFKYGQLTYKQKWLVIQGSQEFAAINERDGVKLGIYVTGIAPVHAGVNSSVVDNREWLEEGEFSGGTEELLESKKLEVVEGIIGEGWQQMQSFQTGLCVMMCPWCIVSMCQRGQ